MPTKKKAEELSLRDQLLETIRPYVPAEASLEHAHSDESILAVLVDEVIDCFDLAQKAMTDLREPATKEIVEIMLRNEREAK